MRLVNFSSLTNERMIRLEILERWFNRPPFWEYDLWHPLPKDIEIMISDINVPWTNLPLFLNYYV